MRAWRGSTSRRRSRRPACARRSGPATCAALVEECGYEGVAVAAVCAETRAQADAALELIEVEWEVLDALLDADEAVARGEVLSTRERERGDVERAWPRRTSSSRPTYRTQTVLHNALETHGSVCRWVGDTLEVYTSTQDIWGVRREVASAMRPPARPGARRLRVHGRRLRREDRRRRLHADRRRARARGPAGLFAAR